MHRPTAPPRHLFGAHAPRWIGALLLLALAGCATAAPQAARVAPGTARPDTLQQDALAQDRASLAAVRSGLGPDCVSTGAAVHVGRQRFLTVAHLVDGTQPLLHGCGTGTGPAFIRFGGQDYEARLLRTGQADLAAGIGTFYVGGRDVALLRAPSLPASAPRLDLCPDMPWPGLRVAVMTPLRRAPSEVASLVREASPIHGAYAELPMRLEPGESGGAVIDPARNCLVGLVSHRQGRSGLWRTRIVPAPVLRAFLGE